MEIEVKQTIENELKLHPKSQIIDIYKFLVQAYLGPNHLNLSYEKAIKYIKTELELELESSDEGVLFQPLGINPSFYRVDLKVISQNIIALPDYCQFFVSSMNKAKTNNFSRIWVIAQQVLLNYFDQAEILSFEKNFNNNLSHSKIYKNLYNPHYRVIHKSFIKSFI